MCSSSEVYLRAVNKIEKHFDEKMQSNVYTGGNIFNHLDDSNISLESTSSSPIHSWANQMEEEEAAKETSETSETAKKLDFSTIKASRVAKNVSKKGVIDFKRLLESSMVDLWLLDKYNVTLFGSTDWKNVNLDSMPETEVHNLTYHVMVRMIIFLVLWEDHDVCPCAKPMSNLYWKDEVAAANAVLRCISEHWVHPMDLLPISPKELWETYGQHIQGRDAHENFKDFIPLLHEAGKNFSS